MKTQEFQENEQKQQVESQPGQELNADESVNGNQHLNEPVEEETETARLTEGFP